VQPDDQRPQPTPDITLPALTSGPMEILSSGPPEGGMPESGVPELAGRRRSRTPLILSIVMVLTLAAAGVAYAGLRLWYGSGAQPEDVTPASAAAFLRLDLDPGISQGRRLESLLNKLPLEAKDTQARLDLVEKSVLGDLGLSNLDFATDIKPWFGNRVGVAVWRSADKEPVALLLLASKDDAKATAALTKVRSRHDDGELGFVLAQGYALVARGERHAQAAAEAAAQEAKEHSLAKLKDFTAAVGTLPPNQTALGWLDLAAITKLMDVGRFGTPATLTGLPLAVDPLGLDDRTGHVVLGAQAVDNGIEARVRVTGASTPPHAGRNVRPVLDALPGNSVVAAAISQDGSGWLNQSRNAVGIGGLFGPGFFDGPDSGDEMLDPQAAKQMEEASRRFSDGMAALLSSKLISASLTTIGGDPPGLMLTAETDSDASARKVVDGATALGPLGLTATTQGSRVEVKTRTYAPSGTLADSALYREAMSGVPDTLFEAFFVDTTRLTANETDRKTPRTLMPVKAVGAGFAVDGTDTVGLVRIVIK